MLLVDSSALVLADRGLIALLDFGDRDIVVCPSVIQEVLQGADADRVADWVRAFVRMNILDVAVPLERFHEAAYLYRTCRDEGITIRKSIDCLIAATAIAHDAVVLHDDRDFEYLASVTPLQARRV